MQAKISPSLMCADFRKLEEQVKELEKAGADYLHCDIMDGQFVPNYALGTDMIHALHGMTNLPLDVHLMVLEPERAVEYFLMRPGDIYAFHYEACFHVQRTLTAITAKGARAGIALNPATPLDAIGYILDDIEVLLIMTVNPGFAGQGVIPATLEKIADARRMVDGRDIEIMVDGNVSFENAVKMRKCGADIFVGGSSSVFAKGSSIHENTKKMRDMLERGEPGCERQRVVH